MNARIIIAVALIVLGIIGLAYGGISYTYPKRVVDAGPLKVDVNKTETLPIAPIAGGLLLAGGVVLLVTGRKAGAA